MISRIDTTWLGSLVCLARTKSGGGLNGNRTNSNRILIYSISRFINIIFFEE